MTTATAARDVDAKAGPGDAGAILFELEGVALQGRTATFEAARKALADHDVKLTAVQFSRFALWPRPELFAEELIEKTGAKKITGPALAEAVNEALAAYYASDKAALYAPLARLLEAAQKQGLESAAITALPAALAEGALARLGVAERIRLFTFSEVEHTFPRADVWLKVARQMGKSPRACIVVADHMAAAKSALAAGMKCIAVPNAFTAHQDFCGADLLLDSWEEMSAREMLDAVVPAR